MARYRVSDPGPLLGIDVVNGSHTGLVAFSQTEKGCEMRWEVSFDCRGRAGFWKEATEFLIGNAADALQQHVAKPSKPYWFDPLVEFGLATGDASDKPLLLVLPGLDGSSVTAWMQYPELGELTTCGVWYCRRTTAAATRTGSIQQSRRSRGRP